MWINAGVNARRRVGGFMDIKQRVTTTTTRSESMHMQDGEGPDISLSSVGKTEMICQ